jgi:transposase InsO family protein
MTGQSPDRDIAAKSAQISIARGSATTWDSRMRPAPKLGIQAWLGHPYAPKQHRSIYRHPDRFWADF